MGTVGTLGVGINADPTGLTKGFARTKAEMQQFERSFTSASNRMTTSMTMLATHFAIVGKTGPEQLKQVATAGISLASVFGPTGMLISGIGLMGITLVNWMTKARDEAKETEEAYRKLATTFDNLAERVAAARAWQLDPAGGMRMAEIEIAIGRLNDKQNALVEGGRDWTLQFGMNERKLLQLGEEYRSLHDEEKKRLRLVTDEAQSQQRLITATGEVAARAEARLKTERELTRLTERRARAAEDEMRAAFARVEEHAANRVMVEQMAGASVRDAFAPTIAPSTVIADTFAIFGGPLEVAGAEAKAFADALKLATEKTKTAAEKAAAQQAEIISSVRGGVGGALAGFGGIGKHLGALVQGGVSGLLGSLSGSLVGGLGKLFGFGRHKKATDESAEALQRLAQKARELNEALNNVPKGFKLAEARGAADRGSLPREPRIPRPPSGGGDRDDGGGGGREGGGRGGSKGSSASIYIETVVLPSVNASEFFRDIERLAHEKSVRGGVSAGQLGFAPAT